MVSLQDLEDFPVNFDETPHSHDYYVSFDRAKMDDAFVVRELASTYWGRERPTIAILRSIDHSLCAGVFFRTGDGKPDRQVGFARAVHDHSTFAWICDVVITKECRGKGLGKFLVGTLVRHPEIAGIPQMLRTHDAHSLYAKMGFLPVDAMRRLPSCTS
jgi:GNAT superfamily N-acetyltransferase